MKKVNLKINKMCNILFPIICIYCFISFVEFGGIYIDFYKPYKFLDISDNDIKENYQNMLFDSSSNMYQTVNFDPQIYLNYPLDNKYKYITIYLENIQKNGKHIDEISSQIFYINNDDYSDATSKRVKLREGKNCIRLWSNKEYQKIRVDVGEEENLSYELRIRYTNRFSGYATLFEHVFLCLCLFFCVILIYKRPKLNTSVPHLMKEYWIELKEFLNRKRIFVCLICLYGIILFGYMINEFTLSIDEENDLSGYTSTKFSIALGRVPMYILSKVLNVSERMTPYVTIFLASIVFVMAVILFSFIFDRWVNKKSSEIASFVFSCLFLSMPFVIGQVMNFAHFSIFIAIGMCIFTIAFYLIYKLIVMSSWHWGIFVAACITTMIGIGIYQPFIAFYVTFCVGNLLFDIYKTECIEWRKLFRTVIVYVEILVLAFIGYEIINKIFQSCLAEQTTYLTNTFVGWNKHMPNEWVLKNVWNNMYQVLRGDYFNLVGGIIIKVSVIAYIIYALMKTIKYTLCEKIIVLFLSLFFLISPFILPLCMGSFILVGRQLLALPLMVGFIWYMILSDINNRGFLRHLTVLLGILLSIYQLEFFNQQVFCDQVRYDRDHATAVSLMHDIEKEVGSDKPIVFLGNYVYNTDLYLKQISGMESFFDMGNNDRMTTFINLQGYNIKYATSEEVIDAQQYAGQLKCWPQSGSIMDVGEYIIVKFSN